MPFSVRSWFTFGESVNHQVTENVNHQVTEGIGIENFPKYMIFLLKQKGSEHNESDRDYTSLDLI